MSVAELKEAIVKEVIQTDDINFLNEVAEFIKSKHSSSGQLLDAQAFQDELFEAHGEVLKRLA